MSRYFIDLSGNKSGRMYLKPSQVDTTNYDKRGAIMKTTKEQQTEQFVSAYIAYQTADIEYRSASRLLESDEENPEYEKLWNAALDNVGARLRECTDLLYQICSDSVPGFTRNDANRMLLKYDRDIMRLIDRCAR